MFDRQLAVYRDPSKQKAVITTRRAGKTDAASTRRAICMCKRPGENSWSGYVTLTKAQSRRNLEGPMRALIAQYKLPITQHENDGQITFTHANGHRLWVGGVDDLRKAERWRGNKWWEFEIDETGAWPDEVLSYFIGDVIEPGLSDTDGTLILNGTPGVLAAGFFFEVTTPGARLTDGREKRPQWSTHQWSVTSNPHHRYGQPGGKEALEAYRLRKGWELDNPTYLREWRGQWASDPDLLIYRYEGAKNAFFELPKGDLQWSLGVDVGHLDDTAFALTCVAKGRPQVYVVRAWGAPGMTQPQRAQEIMRIQHALEQRFKQRATVAFDTGGLGAALAHDLAQTYGVGSQRATKQDKGAAIRVVRDALLSARLLVCPFAANPDDPIGLGAAQLISEWSVLPWDDDRKDHRKGYSDHCPDALLYAVRAQPIWERWDEEPPTPGTPAAIDKEMREYKSKLAERIRIMHEGSRTEVRRLLQGGKRGRRR